ncbi:inducible metalloproteinase inhibitor protein-like isoform X1 [Leguminivora glycinivorella]|uniref:inducible metalloproteinase inhibitor protein-like isoform X1 n=1 Tax=Leguminivora glycinivorella TaxID=1035111 RepID=UPI0020104EF0|nr:inducible metalloproteinase inhibitor protein-like isoform X1 [Leguminivora glycinivorella]
MDRYLLFLVISGFGICGANPLDKGDNDETAIQCSGNEVFSSCTNGGCDARNCSQLGKPVPCVKLRADSCIKGCLCKPGYLRAASGKCVEEAECHKACGVDETKHYCPADCASDYCPKGPKTVACARPNVCPPPQCKCRFNHRRAENGTCIPTRECPPFKCVKPNEEYHPCPPLCPNGSCRQATPSGGCPPIRGSIGRVLECNPSCRCKKGYFWNEDKVCVPYNQCPGKSDSNASE